MKNRKNKSIILITGASSGIGQEFAKQLDLFMYHTDEIWLLARREDRLTALAGILKHKCRIVVMDVSDREDMNGLTRLLKEEHVSVKILVNAAGFGLMGAFDKLSIEEQTNMIAVNCKALTEMTYTCIPFMQENARIIQLASSAAFLPQKYFAVYAASKAYVLSFSRALREELRGRKIWVTAVCPGPVKTEFFDIAEKYGTTLAIKKLTMISPQRVVTEALWASYHKKPLAVSSFLIKAFHVVSKILPHTWILWLVGLFK